MLPSLEPPRPPTDRGTAAMASMTRIPGVALFPALALEYLLPLTGRDEGDCAHITAAAFGFRHLA